MYSFEEHIQESFYIFIKYRIITMKTVIECFNRSKIERLKKDIQACSFNKSAAIYKALSNQSRLAVLQVLSREPCCVCDLAHVLECPVPTVSQYLKILKGAGLIQAEKSGKFIIYSLTLLGTHYHSQFQPWSLLPILRPESILLVPNRDNTGLSSNLSISRWPSWS